MASYVTKQGDVLDALCWQHYGRSEGVTELVLNANPGLADLGSEIPMGTVIELPDIPDSSNQAINPVRLWD